MSPLSDESLSTGPVAESPRSSGQTNALDVYEEYLDLLAAGEDVNPDAYLERHPEVRSSLAKLLCDHQFWVANSHLVAADPKPRPAPPVPEAAWPQAGQTFLDFALLEVLGRGGFARVFRAADTGRGDRPVVVKVCPRGALEGRILGPLDHPGVAPVDSVRSDPATGLTAVCMPYLGRATLHNLLDRVFAGAELPARASVILAAAADPACPAGGRPAAVLRHGTYLEGVCQLAARVAEALAYLHGRGVYHCDLKPSNVLLRPDGEPVLIDFNLSSAADSLLPALGGTPGYTAPEQLRGEAPADDRSDLFSLGVLLYELLTGRRPFGPVPVGLSAEASRDHHLARQAEGFLPVRAANPAVPARLARVVENCLAPRAEDRPASAQAVADAFRTHLSFPRRGARWAARNPSTILAVVIALTSLVSLGAYLNSLRPSPSDLHRAEARKWEASGDLRKAVEHYDWLVGADPTDLDALQGRGRCSLRLGLAAVPGQQRDDLLASGREDFLSVLAVRPGDAWANVGLGYYWQGYDPGTPHHPVAARLYLEALGAGAAPNAGLWNDLGLALSMPIQQGKNPRVFLDALACLNEALRLEPKAGAARYNRAWVALKMSDAADYLPFRDRDAVTARKRAYLLRAQADINEALRLLPEASDLHRAAAAIHGALLRVAPDLADPAAVERHLVRAVRLGENPPSLWAWGGLYFRQPALKGVEQLVLGLPAGQKPPPRTVRVLDPLGGPGR